MGSAWHLIVDQHDVANVESQSDGMIQLTQHIMDMGAFADQQGGNAPQDLRR